MTLLDRYLIKKFLANWLLVLSSLLAVYLLIDFFERIDDFIEHDKSIGLAATYFLLKIPFILDQLSPVCVLLAGTITVGLLYRNKELMSLYAGGINIFRIFLPILYVSCGVTLITLANAQWIFPHTVMNSERIWQEEVKNNDAKGIVRHGWIFYKGKEGFYSFTHKRGDNSQFENFKYTALNTDNHMQLFLTAEKASWIKNSWLFMNGQLKTLRDDGAYNIEIFSEKEIVLPDSPADFFVPPYQSDLISISKLIKQWSEGKDQDTERAKVELNRRLSFIFLGIPLLVIAIPVMLLIHSRLRADLAITIPASCTLAFSAWALWNGGQALSQVGQINPIPASWSIHILLIASGYLLLWRLNRI